MSIMDKYQVTNIREYLENTNSRIGEERLNQILSSFFAQRIRMLSGF